MWKYDSHRFGAPQDCAPCEAESHFETESHFEARSRDVRGNRSDSRFDRQSDSRTQESKAKNSESESRNRPIKVHFENTEISNWKAEAA
jgi:hypothetical protein